MNTTAETLAVVDRHWQALCAGKFAEVIADYAEDAVLIAATTGVVKGRAAIAEVFKLFMSSIIPAASTRFTLLDTQAEGTLGYIVWSGESITHRIAFSSDTFVIRDGRIVQQTSAGNVATK